MREAVMLAFCDPAPEMSQPLHNLSNREWSRLLWWLDTSGLALYFLHQMDVLQRTERLPGEVIDRLRRNLAENTTRTDGMFAELRAICLAFESAGVSFAVLKGFSLFPHSVPLPELRSQLDLDFLVAARSAPLARQVLEARGYHLRATSGRSWEFKAGEAPGRSLKTLYSDGPQRCAEMHVEESTSNGGSVLDRAGELSIRDIHIPVLSPPDLLLGQGMHVFKHICSEFSRTAHLLEFRRHVIARYNEAAFWSELQHHAELNPRAPIALGVVILLITRIMGEFAPKDFTRWTVDCLPPRARRWVELYGTRVAFASFPGNKHYLFLQRDLAILGIPAKRSLRQALLPLRLPPIIIHAQPNETQRVRFQRYFAQICFVLFRFRFHALATLSYLRESLRWRRYTSGLVL